MKEKGREMMYRRTGAVRREMWGHILAGYNEWGWGQDDGRHVKRVLENESRYVRC